MLGTEATQRASMTGGCRVTTLLRRGPAQGPPGLGAPCWAQEAQAYSEAEVGGRAGLTGEVDSDATGREKLPGGPRPHTDEKLGPSSRSARVGVCVPPPQGRVHQPVASLCLRQAGSYHCLPRTVTGRSE